MILDIDKTIKLNKKIIKLEQSSHLSHAMHIDKYS